MRFGSILPGENFPGRKSFMHHWTMRTLLLFTALWKTMSGCINFLEHNLPCKKPLWSPGPLLLPTQPPHGHAFYKVRKWKSCWLTSTMGLAYEVECWTWRITIKAFSIQIFCFYEKAQRMEPWWASDCCRSICLSLIEKKADQEENTIRGGKLPVI